MSSLLLDAERCIMYVYDPLSRNLVTKAARGITIEQFSVSSERGIVGLAYRSKEGVNLPFAYKDPRFDRSLDKDRMSITRDIICVPLKAGDNCVGCLEVANKREGKFTDEDYKLAGSIARELAVGLIAQYEKDLAENFLKENSNFKENVRKIADKNLLNPLLKNILVILAELLKSER